MAPRGAHFQGAGVLAGVKGGTGVLAGVKGGTGYLHYALDERFARDVLPRLRGRAKLIRYADDFVIGFEFREDADRVWDVLPKRMQRYGLTLHPER